MSSIKILLLRCILVRSSIQIQFISSQKYLFLYKVVVFYQYFFIFRSLVNIIVVVILLAHSADTKNEKHCHRIAMYLQINNNTTLYNFFEKT